MQLNYPTGSVYWMDQTPEERKVDRARQQEEWGFNDTDLICLRSTIAEFIAPRLRRFADFTMSFPSSTTAEKWAADCNAIADKLESEETRAEAMQWVADNFEDLWS